MFLRSALLAAHGYTAVFSRRHGGHSAPPYNSLNLGFGLGDDESCVQSNVVTLCNKVGVPLPHRCRQTHGIRSHWCHGPGMMHTHEADLLLSHDAKAALAVQTADCLPILLADATTGIHAAVHAGWRGSAAGIARHAIRQMQHAGASSASIVASLGPCIQPCCFEVDAATARKLAASHPQAEHHMLWKGEKAFPNLQAINRLQLLGCGLKPEHIETLPHCTCCQTQDFFSWRRDKEKSGRMLAIVYKEV